MDNSFGYKNEDEDIRMLTEIYSALKNRIIVLEIENMDWRIANFEPGTFLIKKNKRYEKRGDLTLKHQFQKANLCFMKKIKKNLFFSV